MLKNYMIRTSFFFHFAFVLFILPTDGKSQKLEPSIDNVTTGFDSGRLFSLFSEKNSFYLSGEDHRFLTGKRFAIDILKVLIKRQNVGNFLLEYPHSYAYLIQRFLETGDSSFVKVNGKIAVEDPEFVWRLKSLYDSNNIKLKLWGVDFETKGLSYSRAIKDILMRCGYDTSRFNLEILEKNIATRRLLNDSVWRLLKSEQRSISMGDKDQLNLDLSLILGGPFAFQKVKKRDHSIFQSIMFVRSILASKGENYRMYGQFGYLHLSPKRKTSLVCLLDKELTSKYNESLFVIAPFYIDCFSDDSTYYEEGKRLNSPKWVKPRRYVSLYSKWSDRSIYFLQDSTLPNLVQGVVFFKGFQ